MVFKKIREHKEYIQDAASWFQAKWDIPQEEYLKSMNESLLKETSIPQWYIMLENDNSIIGGIGVIENDFHNRKDLTPNICFKFRKYSNNVIKKAKEFDNSMIITILMSPDKRYSTL